MGCSYHAYLALGVLVTREDFFRKVTSPVQCPQGHDPATVILSGSSAPTQGKFCTLCGGLFASREVEEGQPKFMEWVKSYDRAAGKDAQDAWESLRDDERRGHIKLMYVSALDSSERRDRDRSMALGYQLHDVSENSRSSNLFAAVDPNLGNLQAKLREELAVFGIPGDRPIQLFLTLYASC